MAAYIVFDIETPNRAKNLPKLKCPHCQSRCADVADAKLKNNSVVSTLGAEPADLYYRALRTSSRFVPERHF